MKSSESSMSVAISKHEREGLSGISTNSDSKMSCSHPNARAGHEGTVSSARISVSVSKSERAG